MCKKMTTLRRPGAALLKKRIKKNGFKELQTQKRCTRRRVILFGSNLTNCKMTKIWVKVLINRGMIERKKISNRVSGNLEVLPRIALKMDFPFEIPKPFPTDIRKPMYRLLD